MKTKTIFILSIILSFFLTSCIDYVQSVTYKDGKFRYYCKITLSKALTEIGENNGKNANETFEELSEKMEDNLRITIHGKKIDTDLETGMEFNFTVDPNTTNPEKRKFLPKVRGDKYYIPLLYINNDSNDDFMNFDNSDDMAQSITAAILSSAKFRVLVSKKIIPQINSAYFKGINASDYAIPFYDYGESFCFEIPATIMLMNKDYDLSRIIINKESPL